MPASQAFLQLDRKIQHYLWAERWEALREVQERSIPLVLEADRDVVIASNTASGKTEAAFLPALTHMLQQPQRSLIVYVSPLKALIDDQFARLRRLCKSLEIPVWPWHGDVTASMKHRFLKSGYGVLLITPESLEATLCTRGTSVAAIFQHTTFFIVDELHAFIGNERGKQLQSLMHRIEVAIGRRVPRVGLSATLGDVSLAARFLRGDGKAAIVNVPSDGKQLLVLVKGFEEPPPENHTSDGDRAGSDHADIAIAKHLFGVLRGSNNLVFPNKRRAVEVFTHLLNQLCDQAQISHEFWPHHGNLSKSVREDTERVLKQRTRPATVICTSTLELGIDIGAVKGIAQIGSPPSVASLLQRLGRSGRRKGEPAILRGYVMERALFGASNSNLKDALRLHTVQTVAVVSLLLEHWVEPPAVNGFHYSTLVQQLLSAIAEHGGLGVVQAYALLCGPDAPFGLVGKKDFAELLETLAEHEILIQDHSGLLLHGPAGDKIVNDYHFYAAFVADDGFTVVTNERTLGTLPSTPIPPRPNQHILFTGRTWLVEKVDRMRGLVYVTPVASGSAPWWVSGKARVHTKVRQRMCALYKSRGKVPFIDKVAQRFLDEGRETFEHLALAERLLLDQGRHTLLLTWFGDSANMAIACLLRARGLPAFRCDLGVLIDRSCGAMEDIAPVLSDIAVTTPPSVDALLANATNLTSQKWDELLSPHLLRETYASSNLAMDEAINWLQGKFPSD